MSDEIQVGQNVVFTGFQDESQLPPNAELLEDGEVYEIDSINDNGEENDPSYNLKVENPKFNSKRKVSKNNQKFIMVDVFGDEISTDLPDEEDYDEEEADEVAEDESEVEAAADDGDDGVEEPAPKPKAKGRGKKKAAKKDDESDEEPVDEADPGLSKMLVLTEDEEDPEIRQLVEESEDIIALANTLVEESNHIDFQLGGILYHIRIDKAYKRIEQGAYAGKGGWADFIKFGLGLEYRKSMYLLDIYTIPKSFSIRAIHCFFPCGSVGVMSFGG